MKAALTLPSTPAERDAAREDVLTPSVLDLGSQMGDSHCGQMQGWACACPVSQEGFGVTQPRSGQSSSWHGLRGVYHPV